MDQGTRTSLSEVFAKWESTDYEEDALCEFDWKKSVKDKLRDGASLSEVRQAALPTIQYELIRLAHEAESEKDRIQAANIVMGQEGEGAVHRVEETHHYDRLPAEQLVAVVASKLDKLAKIIPGFELERLLGAIKESEPIEAEYDIKDSEGS